MDRSSVSFGAPTLPRLGISPSSMMDVDRRPWVAGVAVESYGVRLGIRLNNTDVLPVLREYLPPGSCPLNESDPIVERLYSLEVRKPDDETSRDLPTALYSIGAEKPSPFPTIDAALQVLKVALRQDVSELAPQHVFVHAGVLEWQGEAILVPGEGFSGKTTLVAALVQAGATYYSDEFAVLDTRGRVWPFAQRLGIRQPGERDQEYRRAEDLGGRTGRHPIPVGLVVVTEYQQGATWQPRSRSLAEGVGYLLMHARGTSRKPELTMDVLQRTMSEAVVLDGVRGEAADAVPAILKALEERNKGA